MLEMIVGKQQGLGVLAGAIRILCGVRLLELNTLPKGPKVFFANHTSHMDFTLIWSVLSQRERLKTRPVAAKDYWTRSRLSSYIGCDIFNAVLIERKHVTRSNNPVDQMRSVLESGQSLIVFPEGTRQQGTVPGPFKSGLFHLSLACPDVPLIPVYLENLNRMLPKGTFLPLPLISRIRMGPPLNYHAEVGGRMAFLEKARQAVTDLSL